MKDRLSNRGPPLRQVALLGEDPHVDNAIEILRPIAERAWRRDVNDKELAPIVGLVAARLASLGETPDAHVEALKEGIVAILVFAILFACEPGRAA